MTTDGCEKISLPVPHWYCEVLHTSSPAKIVAFYPVLQNKQLRFSYRHPGSLFKEDGVEEIEALGNRVRRDHDPKCDENIEREMRSKSIVAAAVGVRRLLQLD